MVGSGHRYGLRSGCRCVVIEDELPSESDSKNLSAGANDTQLDEKVVISIYDYVHV